MHQQEVARIGFLTYSLRYTGCHRNGRYTGRTDQRVDLILGKQVHEFSQQYSSGTSQSESQDSDYQDGQSLVVQESCCGSCRSNRNTQKDGGNIHQFVLNSLTQTFYNSTFTHQVT